jgi:hypothetical protein
MTDLAGAPSGVPLYAVHCSDPRVSRGGLGLEDARALQAELGQGAQLVRMTAPAMSSAEFDAKHGDA